MEARIEYDNPVTVGKSEKVAAGSKTRRESGRRKPNSDEQEPGKSRSGDTDGGKTDPGDAGVPRDLGKRIDLEA